MSDKTFNKELCSKISISKKLNRADNVATWRLCMGCGACKWACPNDAISLINILDKGIRPFIDESKCAKCGDCSLVCPGKKLEHKEFPESVIAELLESWGPILEIYEGYASDDTIRYIGSSGGVATALALFAIEKIGYSGVLHIKSDPENPLYNIPTYSKSREEIIDTCGSRYAPAAPCQGFDLIKRTDGLSMFIGKPCDCAALRKACEMDSELAENVGLIVSIFCAGTPNLNGTMEILKEMNISNPDDVKSFRYRGNGWPGMVTAVTHGNLPEPVGGTVVVEQDGGRSITYAHAWGDILTKHGQLRCRLCPDGTGEFADIALGDPWYRETNGDPGRSLILVRSNRGLELIKQDDIDSFLKIAPSHPDNLHKSQKSVLNRKCQIWGRLLSLKLFSVPQPIFSNFSLKNNWKQNNLKMKFKTIVGTIRRIVKRKWTKPEIYYKGKQE